MPTLAEDLTTPIEETVFEEDNLMDENSVSPEEFAELTGITMVEVSSEKVDEAVEQASASLEQASLTWGPTKPWVNSTIWNYTIVYDLNNYYINSSYTANYQANTYAQEALIASASQGIYISATPTDSRSTYLNFYVNVIDDTTGTNTSLYVGNLTNSAITKYIQNPYNRSVHMVMNLANSSTYNRYGNITITAD